MEGLLRSCQKEMTAPLKGKTLGKIPDWLQGTLIRNGPGMFNVGDTSYKHAFDGLGLLHNFTIERGSVTYLNKFLRSDRYRTATANNRIVLNEFGTSAYPDPCKTLWQRFMSTFFDSQPITDNCNVSFCPYNDELYAATESQYIWKVDPTTLDSLEKVDLSKHIAVNHATAHCHIDTDGSVWNIGSSYSRSAAYRILQFPRPQHNTTPPNEKSLSSFDQAAVKATIPSRWSFHPAYYHSFSITENYIVFIEQPFALSVLGVVQRQLRNKSFADNLIWYPEYKAVFHVIDKNTGDALPHKYESDVSFCFFHTINAYEEDSHLVLDLCAYNDADVVKQTYIEHLEAELKCKESGMKTNGLVYPTPWRFVLPLQPKEDARKNENLVTLKETFCTAVRETNGTITCKHAAFEHCANELPAINYKYNGKKYRYFYGITEDGYQMQKLDWERNEITKWKEAGAITTAPIFVSAPNSVEEDQGVVLFVLLKQNSPQECALVVLDAQTFTELGRSEFTADDVIPLGLHVMFKKSESTTFTF